MLSRSEVSGAAENPPGSPAILTSGGALSPTVSELLACDPQSHRQQPSRIKEEEAEGYPLAWDGRTRIEGWLGSASRHRRSLQSPSTESFRSSLRESPKLEEESPAPWPPNGQERRLSTPQITPSPRIPFATSGGVLNITLLVLPSAEARALDLEAKDSGEPHSFNILDGRGELCAAARCDSQEEWETFQKQVRISLLMHPDSLRRSNQYGLAFAMTSFHYSGHFTAPKTFTVFAVLIVLLTLGWVARWYSPVVSLAAELTPAASKAGRDALSALFALLSLYLPRLNILHINAIAGI